MANLTDAPSWPLVLDATRRMQEAERAGRVHEHSQCADEREGLIGVCEAELAELAEPEAAPEPVEAELDRKAEPETAPEPVEVEETRPEELDRKAGIARSAADKKAKAAKKKAARGKK